MWLWGGSKGSPYFCAQKHQTRLWGPGRMRYAFAVRRVRGSIEAV
jgi:hypothetical protein